MSEPAQKSEPTQDDSDPSPGQWFLYGIVCLLAGGGLFFWLQSIEATGGGARIHWLVALLYNLGGKWTVAVVFGLLGALFVVIGVTSLGKKK